MANQIVDWVLIAIPMFCFGYPFIMSWYWMVGGALYYFEREMAADRQGGPQPDEIWPPISILVPCYNEGENAAETLLTAAATPLPSDEQSSHHHSRRNTGSRC